MATKIVTKNSSTASAVPTASDLVQGELAVNVADKRLFTEDNGGSIVELGTNPYNFTANHNGSAKLATTSTGIDVTGDVNTSGLLKVGTNDTEYANNYVRFKPTGAAYIDHSTVGQAINFRVSGSSSLDTNALTINSTGIDVTGTATMDGGSISGNLLIGTSSSSAKLTVGTFGDTARAAQFHGGSILVDGGAATDLIMGDGNVAYMSLQTTDNATAMKIRDHSGNADLVTVERASGNVGIGTGSPSGKLEVSDGSTAKLRVNPASTEVDLLALNAAGTGYVPMELNASEIRFDTSATERMRISSAGNVGIGTSSPASPTGFGSSGILHLKGGAGNDCSIVLEGLSGSGGRQEIGASGGALQFYRGAATGSMTESMRIDSSGNLLAGTTATDTAAVGFRYRSSLDAISSVADGGISAYFGRRTSDGDIVAFRKDDAIVGNIGSHVNGLLIGTTEGSDAFLKFESNAVRPSAWNGSYRDAAIDLGHTSSRFKDLYLSGGVYLGGTGAANKLDDYEEGVHVTTFSGTGTVGLTSASLNYTKVGRMVTVGGQVQVTSQSGVSGGIRFTLPFTSQGLEVGAVRLYSVDFTDTARGPICYTSGANLEFAMSQDNTSATNIPVTTNGYYMFSITYQTS
jgi:hypothetical protein